MSCVGGFRVGLEGCCCVFGCRGSLCFRFLRLFNNFSRTTIHCPGIKNSKRSRAGLLATSKVRAWLGTVEDQEPPADAPQTWGTDAAEGAGEMAEDDAVNVLALHDLAGRPDMQHAIGAGFFFFFGDGVAGVGSITSR